MKSAMQFELIHSDGDSRAGIMTTAHGAIETPAFMPCGTIGAVKAVRWCELEELGYQLVLVNALHLYLRPGVDVVRGFGGVHDFTTWKRSVLADSGGYQFFSLKGLYKIDEGGVTFQSPYDGSSHRFTPESLIDLQVALGSDLIMPLDHCAPGDASRERIIEAGERTVDWLIRAAKRFGEIGDDSQALFGIVQGGVHIDLRKQYLERSAALHLPGYALGGISVGEEHAQGDEVVREIAPLMPSDKPRYLMGVGLPDQILDAVSAGIDMFDCVLPTRMARNGTLFTSQGRVNITNARFKSDPVPLDPKCSCPACRRYSRAYLAHLYKVGDPGVLGLLSLHNLAHYWTLVREAREAILANRFGTWKAEMMAACSALPE
jgi:queuine tRNA-ribosyltransferase